MTLTEAQLVAWGERVGATIGTPVFVALRGDLGAGKSVLARAIARGAGVVAVMPSPTFNLVFRYAGRDGIEVVHMDLYRLERPEEVWALGWSELGAANEIALVEWAERAGSLLPPDRWDIRIDIAAPALRTVTATPIGSVPHVSGLPA
ncbi:MAG: tRNA (adenosine(37)-N6)-threonylcarbamoyltransferase complex ATPase subunit type 1 TsaE [Longimicrobiales bacterium]